MSFEIWDQEFRTKNLIDFMFFNSIKQRHVEPSTDTCRLVALQNPPSSIHCMHDILNSYQRERCVRFNTTLEGIHNSL